MSHQNEPGKPSLIINSRGGVNDGKVIVVVRRVELDEPVAVFANGDKAVAHQAGWLVERAEGDLRVDPDHPIPDYVRRFLRHHGVYRDNQLIPLRPDAEPESDEASTLHPKEQKEFCL